MLEQFLGPETTVSRLHGSSPDEILAELASALSNRSSASRGQIYAALRAREELGSTALEQGVAVPHCRLPNADRITLAVGLSRAGVAFGSPDGSRTRLFAALIAPTDARGAHLRVLSRVSAMFHEREFVEAVLKARDDLEVYAILLAKDAALDRAQDRLARPGAS